MVCIDAWVGFAMQQSATFSVAALQSSQEGKSRTKSVHITAEPGPECCVLLIMQEQKWRGPEMAAMLELSHIQQERQK